MNKKIFFLKMLLSSILRRKSRILIALLSVAIGSTILFGLITLFYYVPKQMSEEFRGYGANLILTSKQGDAISSNDFDRSLNIITDDSIGNTNEVLVGTAKFKFNNIKINEQPFLIAATDFDETLTTLPFWEIEGELPKNQDEILVGLNVSEKMSLSLGQSIHVQSLQENSEAKLFKITGFLRTGDPQEDNLFTSFDGYKRLFEYDNSFDLVQCSIKAQKDNLESLAMLISNNVTNVKASLVKRLVNSEELVLGKLKALVFIVTIVVLALTMVCVSTTMMAVVSERRREIGLRKALGALNKSIIQEFFGEAILLGLLGGILGVILGYLFALYVSYEIFSRGVEISFTLVLLTLFISILVTLLASFIPVIGTTKVKPALVLKGE